MTDVLHVGALQANFRVGAGLDRRVLATLPVVHPVTDWIAVADEWRPCGTEVDGQPSSGFASAALLRALINPEVDRLIRIVAAESRKLEFGRRKETAPASLVRIKTYWQYLRHLCATWQKRNPGTQHSSVSSSSAPH